MGHKALETTHNINNAFGLGTANEHTVQWWFRKFCKRDSSFKDEEHSGQLLKVGSDHLRGSWGKLPKNSTILLSFGIWNKFERWKSSISGCLTSRPEIFLKIVILKCHLLLLYAKTMSHFWIGLWHITKSGFYITTSNDHFSGWSEKKLQNTSQSQTCTNKRAVVTVRWSAAAFWILQDHYIWEVSSANQWDAPKTATPAAGIGQQKGPNTSWQCPIALLIINASKIEQIGVRSFA